MVARYLVRQGEAGWTIMDTWLNEPAIADGHVLTDLSLARAEIIASLLNWRVAQDDFEQSA